MAETTGIAWSDSTWTPLQAVSKDNGKRGCACVKVSPGCKNCYSETMQLRNLPHHGTGLEFTVLNIEKVNIVINEEILMQPLKWKKPRMIFVCSQTDLFGEFVPDEMIDRVFAVMALCPQHTWQVLSKRADRMLHYMIKARSRISALLYNERYGQGTGLSTDDRVGRVGGGRRRPHLEIEEAAWTGSENRGRLSHRVQGESLREGSSGVSGKRRIFANSGNGEWESDRDRGAQGCLVLREQSLDSIGPDNQSQERDRRQGEQCASESGTGDLQRAANTRTECAEGETSLPQGSDSSKDEADRFGCDRDQANAGGGIDGKGDSIHLSDEPKGYIGDLLPKDVDSYLAWPLPNVWLGVSAENQEWADKRIELLRCTPAAVRFVSFEPLLGPITADLSGISWAIVGGESGHGARPMNVSWAEDLIEQCRGTATACFVKQLGANPRWAGANCLPTHHALGKCDDPSRWPESLRVQQFPEVRNV